MWILYFAIGMLVGFAVGRMLFWRPAAGALVLERSDPEDRPYLFLDLDIPLHEIAGKKTVRVRVEERCYLARK